MKLTKINIAAGTGVITVSLEMSATTLYRLVDAMKDMVPKGAASFETLQGRMTLTEDLDQAEKDSIRIYQDAEMAVKQRVISSLAGDFSNT